MCHLGVVYDRSVERQVLTFAVSGKLWNKSLVMVDEETRSEWSHQLGRCMKGPLEGTDLTIIPSTMTNWQAWRSTYPETTIVKLKRSAEEYRTNFYTPANLNQYVIGLTINNQSIAWTLDRLANGNSPIRNTKLAGRPILVVWDDEYKTAHVFERILAGTEYEFRWKQGRLTDHVGGEWDFRSGACVRGKSKGGRLPRAQAMISLKPAWELFRPKTHWKE